jgi:hypothetical protein
MQFRHPVRVQKFLHELWPVVEHPFAVGFASGIVFHRLEK